MCKNQCFKFLNLTLDCQLSWYLVLWRMQAEWKYQTGKLPSDLLQTYCQLLEPTVPVPAVMGECHSLWLFGSHVYSDSFWGEKKKKNIAPQDGGIRRREHIVWALRTECESLWCSGLRFWCCCSCSIGCSCGSYSVSGLGTSICHGWGKKKKKRFISRLMKPLLGLWEKRHIR